MEVMMKFVRFLVGFKQSTAKLNEIVKCVLEVHFCCQVGNPVSYSRHG